MKVYIVTNYADGEDFSGETDIEGVFSDRTKALARFYDEVNDWKDYAGEDDEVEENEDGTNRPDDNSDLYYEVTNYDADYHGIVKLIVSELED